MKLSTFIVGIILGIALLSGIVEIVHPAPKLIDFCQQPSCRLNAQDVLSVKSEDYRGGLMFFYLICLGAGAIGCVCAFLTKYYRPIVFTCLILIISAVLNIVMLRFLTPFTWWPVQSWMATSILFFGSATVLLMSKNRRQSAA